MAEEPRGAIVILSWARSRVASTVGLGRAIAVRAQAAEITFLAAAVAYYAFLSLLPALLLILSIGTAVGGDALADALVAAAGDLLTPTGRNLVRDALENAAGRTGATVAGVVLLLWSVLKVFRGLDIAFLKVYGSEEAASLGDQIRDGLVAVVGVGTGLAVMFGVGAVVSAFELELLLDVLGILVLPSVLTVVFLPLYYVFPDMNVSVGEVLPGALFAGVGWTVLQAGFQIYAANAGQYQAYGVLGGVLLLVIWFYLAATVLLLGAVVNVVLAGRSSPVIEPGDGGDGEGRRRYSPTGRQIRALASGDRQLQQSPGSQENTTPMVPEDDHSGRDGTEKPDSDDERQFRSDGGSPPDDGSSSDDDESRGESATSGDEEIPSWKGGTRSSGDAEQSRDADSSHDPFERDGGGTGRSVDGVDPAGAPDISELKREVDRLRSELDEFEQDVDSRTVKKPELKSELERYVRWQMRRGHARGWGPYLVLLYGTVLTLGAFYWLEGIYSIGAMIILALSTLGLYVLFVLFGIGLNLLDVPVRAVNAYRRRRE